MVTDEEYLDALDTLCRSDRAKLDPLCLALIEKFEAELAKRRQADEGKVSQKPMMAVVE
jgi:hypothetical protein